MARNELIVEKPHLPWRASHSATKQSNYGVYKASVTRGEGMGLESVRITADTRELALEVARNAAAASDLLELAKLTLKWIDAVPQDVPLPAMPGFDRDWANEIIAKAEGK